MAFLNSTTHRPSCIISALPKRFSDELEKNLSGAVALTTCDVEELEKAVNLRGATIAVVGASRDSIDVAERLSHEAKTVKVFLAHYQDCSTGSTPVNGFAGVFDLRSGPEKLASTIRQAVLKTPRVASVPLPWKPRRRMTSHLIDIHKSLHNPEALFEKMLEAFLDQTGAREGILLVPDGMSQVRFCVVASEGDNIPPLGQKLFLGRELARALREDERIDSPFEVEFTNETKVMKEKYRAAIPILVNGSLKACFLVDHLTASNAVDDFMESSSFLLHLLDRKKRSDRSAKVVAAAREEVCGSWILADRHGRVMHREGKAWSQIAEKAEVTEPRLRDAIARVETGVSWTRIQENLISCRELQTEDNSYFLLGLHAMLHSDKLPPPQAHHAGVVQRFDRLPQARILWDKLRRQMALAEDGFPDLKVELAVIGISLPAGLEGISQSRILGISLILLAARVASGQPVTGRAFSGRDAHHLTIEAQETGLAENTAVWTQDPLIAWSIAASGLAILSSQSCTFGFQLKFTELGA